MGAPGRSEEVALAPEARPPTTRQTPLFLAYAIAPVALAFILVLKHWGFMADEPWWAYALVLAGSIFTSRLVEDWGVAHDSPLRIDVRLGIHAASVTAVVYMSGWGPMLGVAYVFAAVEDISVCGSRVWRPALLWSLAGVTVGQALIWVGWAPSFVPRSRAEGLGVAGAFVLAFVIRMAGAADEQKETAEAALAHQALHDPLTKLPNRKLLVDRVDHAMARVRRAGGPPPVVMFLDLDRFKLVNDSLGHSAGDELLVQVSQRLQSVLRESDTLSRFGGDEFVVLCEDVDGQRAIDALARRILGSFDDPFDIGVDRVQIGVSVGVAVVDDDVANCESLLSDADAAMYLAKEQRGGDKVRLFDDATRVAARHRVLTETALHRALERDEFELYYQPVMSFLSGRIEAVEALLRWHHPERGILAPDEFLGLAERTGVIVPIGEWVLVTALNQVQAWNAERAADAQLALNVNMSARQLTEPLLTGQLEALVSRYSPAPHGVRLSLELTEAFSVLEDRRELGRLTELSELGIDLVIDDFGTGNSSLAYVKELPVAMIKLDGMFIADLGTDPRTEAIVRGVIELAHRLGVRVTAESVEEPRQRDRLKVMSCDYGQGFLFGRPQPAGSADLVLATSTPA